MFSAGPSSDASKAARLVQSRNGSVKRVKMSERMVQAKMMNDSAATGPER